MTIEFNKSGRLLGRLQDLCLSLLLLAIGGVACTAHAGTAAIVMDATTGKVLDSVNADQQDYPASLTKMMTIYLAFDQLKAGKLKLDQQLPVSAWAADKEPTKLGLRSGQTITVRDCILGMVTKSANDAATVMAEGIGGTESHFAEMMNAQAALLGMSNTHFDNASGLPDPNNVSTAHDLLKLAMALYNNFPEYSNFFATREFTFRGHIVRGHNNLMYRYPGMDGLKTGFTDASGFNLASTAERDGHRLFGVVLGGRNAAIRDELMARLLDDGFDGRQTPDDLVAAIGRHSTSSARRLLAVLSPIQDAEADTIPASQRRHGRIHHTRHGKVMIARNCSSRRGASCTHRVHSHHSKHAETRLASRSVKKSERLVARTDD